MTDYKNLKLIASSSPHIRGNETTRGLMRDVLLALLPALVMAAYVFGARAIVLSAVSVASAVGFEWLYRKLMKKHQTVDDLSAAVTGLLLAMVCPVQLPYWTVVIGNFFAIFVVKQLFGGLGKNFVNPALAGRAFLLASYSVLMTTWAAPMTRASVVGADAVTAATPMSYLSANNLAGLKEAYSVSDMLLGKVGGSLGEVSALMLLAGGAYLIARKVITWHIPVAYIGTVALLTLLFPRGNDAMEWMLYNVLGGGLMLGAIFMATDYVTSPVTKKGQLIYGVGCGLLTVFIRYFGAYPEGVCYSIMTMNLCVWLIDSTVKPARFGVAKSNKKEGATK